MVKVAGGEKRKFSFGGRLKHNFSIKGQTIYICMYIPLIMNSRQIKS